MSFPNSFEHSGRPKCARCRHHGIVTPKKGHTKICPFLSCECSKCYLITQRTKIHAFQREMRKIKKEQQLGAGSGDGEAPSTSAPAGPPSAEASEKGAPEKGAPEKEAPEKGAPEKGASEKGAPVKGAPVKGALADPWRRPEPGGQAVSGSNSRDELPSTSDKPPPPSSACFSELGQMALPFIPFPFRMPSYYPSSFSSPHPHLLPNMPWVPPVPVGFGPVMFPQLQQGAMNYPPAPHPRPPASCMQVFIRHPLRVSETIKNQQHPPPPVPKTTEQDTAEQVDSGE